MFSLPETYKHLLMNYDLALLVATMLVITAAIILSILRMSCQNAATQLRKWMDSYPELTNRPLGPDDQLPQFAVNRWGPTVVVWCVIWICITIFLDRSISLMIDSPSLNFTELHIVLFVSTVTIGCGLGMIVGATAMRGSSR